VEVFGSSAGGGGLRGAALDGAQLSDGLGQR
jgi:hypothetical protein